MTIAIDQAKLDEMSQTCQTTGSEMMSAAALPSGDTDAASSGLSGWQTAAELSNVLSTWTNKASAISDSYNSFSEALQYTKANFTQIDDETAMLIPELSPILQSEPPWDQPE